MEWNEKHNVRRGESDKIHGLMMIESKGVMYLQQYYKRAFLSPHAYLFPFHAS